MLYRRCRVADAGAGAAAHQQSAGVGNARDTGAANHAANDTGSATGNIANRTDSHRPHRHGDGATTVASAHGKAGGAGQGDDTAAPSHDSDTFGSAERDHRGPTGCDVAVQPASSVIEHHHQRSDPSERGPELRQPVLYASQRDVSRSCAGRIPACAAWAR